MTGSTRFQILVSELATLRTHLLPAAFDPTGSYPPEVLTHALAYRVLAHAELESFFEDRVLEAARAAKRVFDKDNKASIILIALLAFSGRMHDVPPETLAAPQENQEKHWGDKIEYRTRVSDAVNVLDSAVRNNHGVKESNLLRLLLPIGVPCDQLDPVFLANMSAFGERRGIAAHSSGGALKTQQPPDPEDELKKVASVLSEVQKLDEAIDELLRDVSTAPASS